MTESFPPPYRCSPLNFAYGVYDRSRQFSAELLSGNLRRKAKAKEPVPVTKKRSLLKALLFSVGLVLSFLVAGLAIVIAAKHGMPMLTAVQREYDSSVLIRVIVYALAAVFAARLSWAGGKAGIRTFRAMKEAAKATCYRGYEIRYGLRRWYQLPQGAVAG